MNYNELPRFFRKLLRKYPFRDPIDCSRWGGIYVNWDYYNDLNEKGKLDFMDFVRKASKKKLAMWNANGKDIFVLDKELVPRILNPVEL